MTSPNAQTFHLNQVRRLAGIAAERRLASAVADADHSNATALALVEGCTPDDVARAGGQRFTSPETPLTSTETPSQGSSGTTQPNEGGERLERHSGKAVENLEPTPDTPESYELIQPRRGPGRPRKNP